MLSATVVYTIKNNRKVKRRLLLYCVTRNVNKYFDVINVVLMMLSPLLIFDDRFEKKVIDSERAFFYLYDGQPIIVIVIEVSNTRSTASHTTMI
jgi:hypothetical protein